MLPKLIPQWLKILKINKLEIFHVAIYKVCNDIQLLLEFISSGKCEELIKVPETLPIRVPFGIYSYTSICSPCSKQNPKRLTRFL